MSMIILVCRSFSLRKEKWIFFLLFIKERMFFYAHKGVRSQKRFFRVNDAHVSMVSSRQVNCWARRSTEVLAPLPPTLVGRVLWRGERGERRRVEIGGLRREAACGEEA